jgi:hypothetical protein
MNYKTALANLDNVSIKSFSPRNYGEKEQHSNWKEIYGVRKMDFIERTMIIKYLADLHPQVWVKTATNGGRARIFYSIK